MLRIWSRRIPSVLENGCYSNIYWLYSKTSFRFWKSQKKVFGNPKLDRYFDFFKEEYDTIDTYDTYYIILYITYTLYTGINIVFVTQRSKYYVSAYIIVKKMNNEILFPSL